VKALLDIGVVQVRPIASIRRLIYLKGGETLDAQSEITSSVRFSKIRDGYSWSITVAAENSLIESLRAAKEHAVAISAELEAQFPPKAPRAEVDEVPY
jgi:hypothetical protein